MENTVASYLSELGIPVSPNYCEELIASHPDYPSLLSIADTLERLGINHTLARVDRKDWDRLPFPCLYYDEDNQQARELKRAKDPDDLPDDGPEEASLVMLKAEPTDEISDEENRKERAKEKLRRYLTMISLAAIAGLILLGILPFETWVHPALLMTAAVGTLVGYLLVAKDVGITYDPVETFCTSGETTDCDAVLRSDAATLWGDITLSDLALCYFLFQLAVVGFLLPSYTGASTLLWGMSLLGLLGVPVVLYSLYWQYHRKTWCRLCLLVDGVLVLQGALFAYLYSSGVLSFSIADINMSSIVQLGLIFLGIGSSVLLIKQTLKGANRSKQQEVKANRIKYDPEIFMQLLSRQERVDTTPFDQEIRIGVTDAPIRILMAASLGCGPCEEGFKKAARLVDSFPGKVGLTIRLKTPSHTNGNMTPGTWLLGYWQQHIVGESEAARQTEQLFRDWFNTRDLEKFRNRYQMTIHDKIDEEIGELKQSHADWMERVDIKGTPTFFVNGRKLPRQYGIEDLMGMIPTLVDHAGNKRMSAARS